MNFFAPWVRKPSLFLRVFAVTLFASAILVQSGCRGAGESAGKAREKAGPSDAARAGQQQQSEKTPAVQVLIDEARLSKPHAIVGGTVQNIGASRLENLSVELELKRRGDGGTETREVSVVPGNLSPGEEGKYTLKLLSEEWSGSRLLRVRGGSRGEELAFKTAPGARRPPEKLPQPPPVNRVVERPRPKPRGEEFINTPETAEPVP